MIDPVIGGSEAARETAVLRRRGEVAAAVDGVAALVGSQGAAQVGGGLRAWLARGTRRTPAA